MGFEGREKMKGCLGERPLVDASIKRFANATSGNTVCGGLKDEGSVLPGKLKVSEGERNRK